MAKRKTMESVNVWEVLRWSCPMCGEPNDGESWLERGDVVDCEGCGNSFEVDSHYASCRPESKPKPTTKGGA